MDLENYRAGFASIAGLDVQLPDDLANAKKALGLLDGSLKEAQDLVANQDSGLWASLKQKVTAVNLDAVKGQVAMMGGQVQRMHNVYNTFDSTTPHAKVADFVKACADVASNVDVIKESSNRNSLTVLAREVGSETVKELEKDAKALSVSIWDAIPLPVKIGGGVVLAVAVILKVKDL